MSYLICCPVCQHACGNEVDEARGLTLRCQYCGYPQATEALDRAIAALGALCGEIGGTLQLRVRALETDLQVERARRMVAAEPKGATV